MQFKDLLKVRMGYSPGDCLGKDQQGRLEPVTIAMRWERSDCPKLILLLSLSLLMFLLTSGKVEQDLGARRLELLNLIITISLALSPVL